MVIARSEATRQSKKQRQNQCIGLLRFARNERGSEIIRGSLAFKASGVRKILPGPGYAAEFHFCQHQGPDRVSCP